MDRRCTLVQVGKWRDCSTSYVGHCSLGRHRRLHHFSRRSSDCAGQQAGRNVLFVAFLVRVGEDPETVHGGRDPPIARMLGILRRNPVGKVRWGDTLNDLNRWGSPERPKSVGIP